MDMKDVTKAWKNPTVRVGAACLAIGIAAGLVAAGGFRHSRLFDERDGRGGEFGDFSRGERDGGGCRMMDGDDDDVGGMMGMHQMPDGSMMANMGGGSDMGSMMMDMTARLEGKSGDALDKIFLEDMVVHHQGAVDMAKLLAAGSKRAEMQKFAADIIRVQSAEIAQMKAWEKSWFGN